MSWLLGRKGHITATMAGAVVALAYGPDDLASNTGVVDIPLDSAVSTLLVRSWFVQQALWWSRC